MIIVFIIKQDQYLSFGVKLEDNVCILNNQIEKQSNEIRIFKKVLQSRFSVVRSFLSSYDFTQWTAYWGIE